MPKKILWFLIGAALAVVPVAAQPSIAQNGVLNANSYQADVARGSWFVIFGSNMGPATLTMASGTPFPTELAGTKVNFTPAAGGAAIDTSLWYTSAGQLAALLPSTAAAGAYDVRVTYNNQVSAAQRVNVVERNFGFATIAQNGSGPAQANNANLNNGISLVRFTSGTINYNNLSWQHRPAYPGETLVLWGTGLGPDPQSDQTGGTSGDQSSAASVRVIVGGVEITPAYAGRSSGSPGLDQINFTLPENITTGCLVPIQVRAGGKLSNAGSIAVSAAGQAQCTHPSLSEAQLRKLDMGGVLTVGALSVAKISSKITVPVLGNIDSTTEVASAGFSRFGVSQVADANFSIVQVGTCSVYRRVGDVSSIAVGTVPQPLNAGSQLTLNGPNVQNRAMPGTSNAYSVTLYSSGFGGVGGTGTPTLAQGRYTIAGTGGSDIGAFSASIDFPGAFTWTNEAALPAVVPRNQDRTFTWTGGGEGLVTVTGFAGNQKGGTQTNPIYDVAVFTCVAQASAGTLTVPSSVLQQLPAVSGDITSGAIGTLALLAVADPNKGQGFFTAPLTAGGNIDLGYFSYAIGSAKIVGFN
jgi:uncharacterized protein (TIGR03437 family)